MANGIMFCVLNEGKEKIYDVIFAQSLSRRSHAEHQHFEALLTASWLTTEITE